MRRVENMRENLSEDYFFLLIPWIVSRCYLRYICCIQEVSHGKETLPPPAKGKTSRPRSL